MRDPARIECIGTKLIALWKTQPDTRLAQLVANVARRSGYTGDTFFVKDDMIEGEIDGQLLKLGISPDAFAYHDDVTAAGLKIVQDKADAHRRHTGPTVDISGTSHDGRTTHHIMMKDGSLQRQQNRTDST